MREWINYKIAGAEHPETLLIIHGLFGSLDNWQSLAKKWSETYGVITIDVRNHGRSFHSDTMHFDQLTLDILEILNRENIDKVSLIGHSMGGKIAMEFAGSYPEKVQKLIIVDVAPYEYAPHHSDVFEALDQVDLTHASDRKDIEQQVRQWIHSESVVQFIMKGVRRNEETMQFEWKFNYPILKNEYLYLIQRIPEKGFDGPTLFIGGSKSQYLTKETSERIFDLYPMSSIEFVEGAGHWVQAEKPEEFYQIVHQFLQK
jgi:pimeloyl-ACP methyl ester carboxylesterase